MKINSAQYSIKSNPAFGCNNCKKAINILVDKGINKAKAEQIVNTFICFSHSKFNPSANLYPTHKEQAAYALRSIQLSGDVLAKSYTNPASEKKASGIFNTFLQKLKKFL